jgi:hypothetical protein
MLGLPQGQAALARGNAQRGGVDRVWMGGVLSVMGPSAGAKAVQTGLARLLKPKALEIACNIAADSIHR